MKSEFETRFLALLRKDVKSKDEMEEMEKMRQNFEMQLKEESKGLLHDLKKVGINISSIWDLVNTKKIYPEAIKILVNHLKKEYHEKIKEGIIRSLLVKEAIGEAPALIEEYKKVPKSDMNLRWIIGNTVYSIVTKEDIEEVLSIVQDKTNGISRQMFVAALGKLKSQRGENALIDLLNDDEVVLDALRALAKLKSSKAVERISLLLNHSNPSVVKEARKALKKVT